MYASMCTHILRLFPSWPFSKDFSRNSSLQEHLSDLRKILLLGQQQPKQNPRLLGIEHSTGNLGLRALPGEISSGDFTVHSTV